MIAARIKWIETCAAAIALACLACSAPAQGQPATQPASLTLTTAGKSLDWLKATARCRELLAGLDASDPHVRPFLPSIADKVAIIQRLDGFDWKSQTAADFLNNLLADLAAGTPPHKRYRGLGVGVPYWSAATDSMQAIWVHVPPSYDPAKGHQLFVCYKSGGGIYCGPGGKATGGHRPAPEAANQTDAFFAWSSLYYGVKGRMGVDLELAEAMPAIQREFNVDPDRVFLTGYSDGGFTSLWLGAHYPHLVAGIAPQVANWQYSNVENVGLLNVPTLVVDGWGDGGYVQANFARFHVLHTMGGKVAGVWGQHGHTYQPYENVAELKRIVEWASQQRRNLYPRRVQYATWNLRWPRAYWVSIERVVDPCLAARIDAEALDGNRIVVKTWNVAAYRLTLADKLVDPAKPVTVTTNDRESYRGPFREQLDVTAVDLPSGPFVKSPATPDDIMAQVDGSIYDVKARPVVERAWLAVRPTGGDPALQRTLAKWWPQSAKADTDITDADMKANNLFLFGGPDINKLTARIAGQLPLRFEPGRFAIGRQVFDKPTECVKFLHPNPLNPAKHVIVYAFNEAAAFARHDFFATATESVWRFRTGDCVVMGIPRPADQWAVAFSPPGLGEEHFIFDSNWRVSDETPLGELTQPLDYFQMLRLRADAIRDAAGADIGVIQSCSPSWIRWKESLPAGPVSLHDLATSSAFPDYITVGKMAGQTLIDSLPRWSATSEPGQIDPSRSYRVAMSGYNLPAYGAEPGKMPVLHWFTSPEEFLAGGHTSLPIREMTQLPIEVTQAVADLVRRQRQVAPRPLRADLAQYLANPQANRFDAMDWLHVGLDIPQGPAAPPARYKIHVGLGGGPRPAAPGRNLRDFVDLRAAGGDFPFTFGDRAQEVPLTLHRARRPLSPAGNAATQPAVESVFVELTLTNRGQAEFAGMVAISPPSMEKATLWPGDPARAGKATSRPEPRYVGLLRRVGPADKPARQDAALFVADDSAALRKVDKHVVANAGFNFGLVAFSRPIRLKPGETVRVPILFVSAGPSDLPLGSVLDALPAGSFRAD